MSKGAVTVFRIARETRVYKASDLSGQGSARKGGRWNARQTPMVYTSTNRALAAMETLVHVKEPQTMTLPGDRYLIEVTIPSSLWQPRAIFDASKYPGWDSVPGSATAMEWGTGWVKAATSLVAVVPSVMVPEECNVLLNPAHRDMPKIKVKFVRKWLYDPRFGY